jgi:hypothetical protein
MDVHAARRKVAPGKFARGEEREHARTDLRPQGFDRVPNERVASVLVGLQEADLERHALAGQRSREAAGLDDVAIVDHGGNRMRGVLVAQKLRTVPPIGEAQPCAWQIAILALAETRVLQIAPIGGCGAAFDDLISEAVRAVSSFARHSSAAHRLASASFTVNFRPA